jgi:uncharacterized membrane protein YjgN (DUF898 family)
MNDISATSPSTPVTRSARVVFSGHRPDFRRLVMRGALLELCTAGFYRFWLATDMRRHMWSHTAVEGDAAEYTGTPKELLIGFLIALAILVPIYLVYALIGIEAEHQQAYASIPLVIFFYAFGQFAIYRARRYRATRTIWRGVRFWMTGSGWSYSWRACLWTLFAALTLGIAMPWREAALERFKMRHTFYGDLPGAFVATGGQLFKRIWWLWLISLVIITLPFTYPVIKAKTWQWWMSGVRVGNVRFESDLPGGALMGLYWSVVGWFLLLLVLDLVLIAAAGVALALALGTWDFEELFLTVNAFPYLAFAANVANYVVLALALSVVIRIYLFRGIWERVANSVTAHGLEAADNVRARGDAVSALGEGFADSLDVGGL